MISVIIPVWNTPIELEKCLKSLEQQTFKDFEVVVVDDGSEQKIKNPKFKIQNLDIKFFRIKHGGAPRARNYGFGQVQGEYILFCDADIELDSMCLDKMRKVLDENSEIDFVYSDFRYGWKKFKFWDFNIKKLKENNYINTCSLVRYEKVVQWDEVLKKFQDWDFWLTLVAHGSRGQYISEILFKANIHRGKISNWLPKFIYKFSGLKKVKRYNQLKQIVKVKHNILD